MDYSTTFKHLTTEEKNKALQNAAIFGDAEAVKILIKTGNIDLDYQDSLARTALIWAAKNGHAEIVNLLTAAGADTSIADYRGQTASMLMNAKSDDNKENSHFMNNRNYDYPFKHHYYNPVVFSEMKPAVQQLKERNMNKAANEPKHSDENCLVM